MTDTEGTLNFFICLLFFLCFLSAQRKIFFLIINPYNRFICAKYTTITKIFLFLAPAVEAQPQKTAAPPVQKEIIGKSDLF